MKWHIQTFCTLNYVAHFKVNGYKCNFILSMIRQNGRVSSMKCRKENSVWRSAHWVQFLSRQTRESFVPRFVITVEKHLFFCASVSGSVESIKTKKTMNVTDRERESGVCGFYGNGHTPLHRGRRMWRKVMRKFSNRVERWNHNWSVSGSLSRLLSFHWYCVFSTSLTTG